LSAAALDVAVGSRIRVRREALNISQASLANRLGLTFSQVQKYEKGSNRIGAGRLFLVAAFLRVPVAYIFEEQGEGALSATRAKSVALSVELEALQDAFLLIDVEARASVLALARSLAKSDAVEPESRTQFG
jgi:transcriptional regulator with XRE-family HTH domain